MHELFLYELKSRLRQILLVKMNFFLGELDMAVNFRRRYKQKKITLSRSRLTFYSRCIFFIGRSMNRRISHYTSLRDNVLSHVERPDVCLFLSFNKNFLLEKRHALKSYVYVTPTFTFFCVLRLFLWFTSALSFSLFFCLCISLIYLPRVSLLHGILVRSSSNRMFPRHVPSVRRC